MGRDEDTRQLFYRLWAIAAEDKIRVGQPQTVWTVWRSEGARSMGLVAVCANSEALQAEVDRQVQWLKDYHGPYYPPRFDKTGDGFITDQFGDRISWHEQELVTG